MLTLEGIGRHQKLRRDTIAPALHLVLGCVNSVLKGKLLASEVLRQQAANNTKEQFAASPDLRSELLSAIMGALDAHTSMSTQALYSVDVQRGLTDILLNYAGLYEALRGGKPT
jgi:type I restriction enzyme, R subunit